MAEEIPLYDERGWPNEARIVGLMGPEAQLAYLARQASPVVTRVRDDDSWRAFFLGPRVAPAPQAAPVPETAPEAEAPAPVPAPAPLEAGHTVTVTRRDASYKAHELRITTNGTPSSGANGYRVTVTRRDPNNRAQELRIIPV